MRVGVDRGLERGGEILARTGSPAQCRELAETVPTLPRGAPAGTGGSSDSSTTARQSVPLDAWEMCGGEWGPSWRAASLAQPTVQSRGERVAEPAPSRTSACPDPDSDRTRPASCRQADRHDPSAVGCPGLPGPSRTDGAGTRQPAALQALPRRHGRTAHYPFPPMYFGVGCPVVPHRAAVFPGSAVRAGGG